MGTGSIRFAAALALAALLAGACGDDDDATAPTPAEATEQDGEGTGDADADVPEEPGDDGGEAGDASDEDDPVIVDDSVGATDIGTVTIGGVETVSIGMPYEDAALEIGFDTSDPTFQEFVDECAYMDPAPGAGFNGLSFMVFDGVVQRIDVDGDGWLTPSGVGIGASEDDLVTAYGDQLEFRPHKYSDTGQYVEFVPSDPGNEGLALLFETEEGRVTTWRVGFADPVSWVEGCS